MQDPKHWGTMADLQFICANAELKLDFKLFKTEGAVSERATCWEDSESAGNAALVGRPVVTLLHKGGTHWNLLVPLPGQASRAGERTGT